MRAAADDDGGLIRDPQRPTEQEQAFTDYFIEDVWRMIFVVLSILLALLVARAAVARYRSRGTDTEDAKRSIPALISYAAFVVTAIYDSLSRFGTPWEWTRFVLYGTALGCGVYAGARLIVVARRERRALPDPIVP